MVGSANVYIAKPLGQIAKAASTQNSIHCTGDDYHEKISQKVATWGITIHFHHGALIYLFLSRTLNLVMLYLAQGDVEHASR